MCSSIVYRYGPSLSRNFYTSLRHTFCALQPAREELHDWHHLVAVAGHAVSRLAVTLDFCELKQALELVLSCRRDNGAI
jgi:hypothetical protein